MDSKKDRRNIIVVIAGGSYMLGERLLSGGGFQQTRKDVWVVLQDIEARKNGRRILSLNSQQKPLITNF